MISSLEIAPSVFYQANYLPQAQQPFTSSKDAQHFIGKHSPPTQPVQGTTSTSTDGKTPSPTQTKRPRRSGQPLSEKRKMQNRAAQKSFRTRRDRYLKDLAEQVSTHAEKEAQFNDRIKRLETENAALRRLLTQAMLPSGKHLLPPAPVQSHRLWSDATLLEHDRPTSATSSDGEQMLVNMDRIGCSANWVSHPVNASAVSNIYTSHIPASTSALATAAPNQHYLGLEDLEAVDWSEAWAHLTSQPQYAQCDRDALWQEFKRYARPCADGPPVIEMQSLQRLRDNMSILS